MEAQPRRRASRSQADRLVGAEGPGIDLANAETAVLLEGRPFERNPSETTPEPGAVSLPPVLARKAAERVLVLYEVVVERVEVDHGLALRAGAGDDEAGIDAAQRLAIADPVVEQADTLRGRFEMEGAEAEAPPVHRQPRAVHRNADIGIFARADDEARPVEEFLPPHGDSRHTRAGSGAERRPDFREELLHDQVVLLDRDVAGFVPAEDLPRSQFAIEPHRRPDPQVGADRRAREHFDAVPCIGEQRPGGQADAAALRSIQCQRHFAVIAQRDELDRGRPVALRPAIAEEPPILRAAQHHVVGTGAGTLSIGLGREGRLERIAGVGARSRGKIRGRSRARSRTRRGSGLRRRNGCRRCGKGLRVIARGCESAARHEQSDRHASGEAPIAQRKSPVAHRRPLAAYPSGISMRSRPTTISPW